MITTGLLTFLYFTILITTSPLRLLPDVSLPSNVLAAITSANSSLASLYLITPYTITAILATLVLVISIEGFIMIWKIINWVLHKIPGIS